MNHPGNDNRLVILGATGTGKTQAAVWHLSFRDYHTMPWTIYNYKADAGIDGIPWARRLELDDVATRPGVYIQSPHPDDSEAVEAQMWEIWRRGRHGVYVDEGYMIGPHNRAFRSLLTQGRSREIPMIVLSQRPVWMDRFVFSESEFFQVFRLQHQDDIRNVEKFVPVNLEGRLPRFHSYYYDVAENKVNVLTPVPSLDKIHSIFDRRLQTLRRVV